MMKVTYSTRCTRNKEHINIDLVCVREKKWISHQNLKYISNCSFCLYGKCWNISANEIAKTTLQKIIVKNKHSKRFLSKKEYRRRA